MKKSKLLTKTIRLQDLRFDEFVDTEDDLSLRAERLQAKRWRKLKKQAA